MISFGGKKYELFFSNKLPPLIALNYADEKFFTEFEKLCGKKYRILSIIKKGWQQKYGLQEDVKKLEAHFQKKIKEKKWAENIIESYKQKSAELKKFLKEISEKDYSKLKDFELVKDIKEVREKSAVLDAMSNMLHLFSSLVGNEFFKNMQKYSENTNEINENFVFFTQPIKESRFAKIKMNKLKNKFKLSEYDSNFSEILRIGAFIKDDVAELLDLRRKEMKSLFIEVSKRLSCSLEDLEYLQIKEIKEFLLSKKNPGDFARERKNITVLFYPEQVLEVFEGNKAEEFIEKQKFKEIHENKDKKVFFGQTASLGKVIGKVVVALDSNQAVKKMKKGDILVAQYTATEYLPAMKKALAVITETGGITSHAAIVSREFKIPCVIGVKEITKNLKDGQKIEVDANKGIIRVLD